MNADARQHFTVCILLATALGHGACGRIRYDRDDASAADAGAVVAPIEVSDLRAEWTTPHGIRWRWWRTGDAADFVAYELVLGATERDVTSRSASARVVGARENPELGVFTLPNTGGMDPVVATLVDGLAPSTHYFAQLVVTHADGTRTATRVAEADTSALPTTALELFDDDARIGYSIPASFVLSTERPLATRACYRFVSDCMGRTSPCWEHLRRQGLNLAPAMPREAFASAYLEISVASDAPEHTYYGAFRLQVGTAEAADTLQIEGVTIRADEAYRTYEIPLSALPRMTWEALQLGVREVGVGGVWSSGAVVRVDEARLRW